MIGHLELGINTKDLKEHFKDSISLTDMENIESEVKKILCIP